MPEALVGFGGHRPGQGRAQRLAKHAHALDVRRIGDDRGEHARLAGQTLHGLQVHLLPFLGHGKENEQLGSAQAGGFEEVEQLPQGKHRQGGGDHGHEDVVRGVEDVLGQQGDVRRAVEKDALVVVLERAQHLGQPVVRLLAVVQGDVDVAVGEVRGQHVEVLVIRAPDVLLDVPAALEQLLAAEGVRRPDAEVVRGRALRVHVAEQRAPALEGRKVGEVDRGGGLAHAALDVVDRENTHAGSSRGRNRVR